MAADIYIYIYRDDWTRSAAATTDAATLEFVVINMPGTPTDYPQLPFQLHGDCKLPRSAHD